MNKRDKTGKIKENEEREGEKSNAKIERLRATFY